MSNTTYLAGSAYVCIPSATSSRRTLIEFRGSDRVQFLHNLCSNDIKQLEVGDGCEAFITNVKGKTIGHGCVFCLQDRLLFFTVADQGEALLQHFDRYLISEDVELVDRSDDVTIIAFNRTELTGYALPSHPFQSTPFLGDVIACRTEEFGEHGISLIIPITQESECTQVLQDAGLTEVSAECLESIRLSQRWPNFGSDITDENLPQEVDRDASAISFTKGCYLGQETVARIDALGHVNKKLVSIIFPAMDGTQNQNIRPGETIISDEQSIGTITSTSMNSDDTQQTIAFAYLKSESAKSVTIATSFGQAKILSDHTLGN